MALLNEQIRGEIHSALGTLPRPVELVFHPGPAGEPQEFMRGLLTELTEVVPELHLVEEAAAPTVEPGHDSGMPVEGPILVVRPAGTSFSGVRFLGVTAGLEFGSLIEAIKDVAGGEPHVEKETQAVLGALAHPVHVQVFTTPT